MTIIRATLSGIALAIVVCSAQAETLLSNLDQARADAKPSPFTSGNGKAVDFTVGGTRPFEVSEVVLRLLLTTESRPKLRILERATAGRLVRVPLNHAAGLDVAGSTHTLAPGRFPN
jgi:hypothetical protein